MPPEVVRIHPHIETLTIEPVDTGVSQAMWSGELTRRRVQHTIESAQEGPIAFTQAVIGFQIWYLSMCQEMLQRMFDSNARLLRDKKH